MKRFLLLMVKVLPDLSTVAVLVLASVFTYQDLTSDVEDREVLNWVFFLLAGYVLTQFLEHLASRVKEAAEGGGYDLKSLMRYESIMRAGLSEPDLGTYRVQKQWDRLAEAKKEVVQIGIAFSNLCDDENIDQWKDIADRCRLSIMMINPDWLEANPIVLERLADHLLRDREMLVRQIRKSLSNLAKVREKLPDEKKENLCFRVYEGIPTMGVTMIDGDLPTARIIIELLPYRCGFRNRPQVRVDPTPGGWYSALAKTVREQWDCGKEQWQPSRLIDGV